MLQKFLSCLRTLLTAALCMAVTSYAGCASTQSAAKKTTFHDSFSDADKNEYLELVKLAQVYNSDNPNMNSWLMNGEHCFLTGWTDEKLQERVIAFVRRPHALTFLFSHLLDDHPDELEVLIDAQLLIYAGEYRTNYDEVIDVGLRANELVSAAKNGRFAAAERQYPSAPIREKIENAAYRSIAGGST